jgi:hypothetical protein
VLEASAVIPPETPARSRVAWEFEIWDVFFAQPDAYNSILKRLVLHFEQNKTALPNILAIKHVLIISC